MAITLDPLTVSLVAHISSDSFSAWHDSPDRIALQETHVILFDGLAMQCCWESLWPDSIVH